MIASLLLFVAARSMISANRLKLKPELGFGPHPMTLQGPMIHKAVKLPQIQMQASFDGLGRPMRDITNPGPKDPYTGWRANINRRQGPFNRIASGGVERRMRGDSLEYDGYDQPYGFDGSARYGLRRGYNRHGQQYSYNRSAAYGLERGYGQYGQRYGNHFPANYRPYQSSRHGQHYGDNRSAGYGLPRGYAGYNLQYGYNRSAGRMPSQYGYGLPRGYGQYGQQYDYNRSADYRLRRGYGRYGQQYNYNRSAAYGLQEGYGGYGQQYGYNPSSAYGPYRQGYLFGQEDGYNRPDTGYAPVGQMYGRYGRYGRQHAYNQPALVNQMGGQSVHNTITSRRALGMYQGMNQVQPGRYKDRYYGAGSMRDDMMLPDQSRGYDRRFRRSNRLARRFGPGRARDVTMLA